MALASMRRACRDEWRLQQFGFHGNGVRTEAFFTPKWRIPQPVFLVYRALVAFYVMAWNIALHATWRGNSGHSSFLFLSHWVYLALGVYLFYTFCVTLHYTIVKSRRGYQRAEVNLEAAQTYRSTGDDALCYESERAEDEPQYGHSEKNQGNSGEDEQEHPSPSNQITSVTNTNVAPLPTSLKISWFLHSTSCNLSIVITLVVYLVMYPYVGELSAITKTDAMTLNSHGISSAIVLLDLFISSLPVRILHFVYPASCGLAYVVFSLIYWAVDKKRNILYPGILDWNDPTIAVGISFGLICVAVPIIQCVLYVVCKLRDLLHSAICL